MQNDITQQPNLRNRKPREWQNHLSTSNFFFYMSSVMSYFRVKSTQNKYHHWANYYLLDYLKDMLQALALGLVQPTTLQDTALKFEMPCIVASSLASFASFSDEHSHFLQTVIYLIPIITASMHHQLSNYNNRSNIWHYYF